MSQHRYLENSILKVVLITDLDGCFIQEKHIFQTEEDDHFRYEDDGIYSKYAADVEDRNKIKANNILNLCSTPSVMKMPLEVYFFSCNLDHALYGIRNLDDFQKDKMADQFAESYFMKEEEFIGFFYENHLIISKEYVQSWKLIQNNLESLQRHSNLHIFFKVNKDLLTDVAKLYIEKHPECI